MRETQNVLRGTHITGWVRGGEAHLDAEFPARHA